MPYVTSGNSEQLAYYNVIRTTIHNFDAIRLNAAIAGLTVSSALIVAALNAIHYVSPIPVSADWLAFINGKIAPYSLPKEVKIPAEYLFGAFLSLIAMTAAMQFQKKIRLYSYFIGEAVSISLRLEADMIGDPDMRLTHAFAEHKHAAGTTTKRAKKTGRGDKIFLLTLKCIIAAGALCLIFFLWEAFSEGILGFSMIPKRSVDG